MVGKQRDQVRLRQLFFTSGFRCGESRPEGYRNSARRGFAYNAFDPCSAVVLQAHV